ncbi:MAG: hypothetical protein R3A47_00050 [Polyangiales bacterium]
MNNQQRLRKDESGAMMLLGLFMSCFLIGGLYYISGVGESVIYREFMQDATDAGSYTTAVMHARGMNTIVLLNILMVITLAIYFVLRVVEVILITITVVLTAVIAGAGALSATGVGAAVGAPVIAIATPLRNMTQAIQRGLGSVNRRYHQTIPKVFKAIHTGQNAVQKSWPLLSVVRGSELASNRKNAFLPVSRGMALVLPGIDFGARPPAQIELPTDDDTFDETCARAKKFAFNTVNLPFNFISNQLDFEICVPPVDLPFLPQYCVNPGTEIKKVTENAAKINLEFVAAPVCTEPEDLQAKLEEIKNEADDKKYFEVEGTFTYPMLLKQKDIAMGCDKNSCDPRSDGEFCADKMIDHSTLTGSIRVVNATEESGECAQCDPNCLQEDIDGNTDYLADLAGKVLLDNCNRLPMVDPDEQSAAAGADGFAGDSIRNCGSQVESMQDAARANRSGCEGTRDPDLCSRSVGMAPYFCNPQDEKTTGLSFLKKDAVVVFYGSTPGGRPEDCRINSQVWIPDQDLAPVAQCGNLSTSTYIASNQPAVCPPTSAFEAPGGGIPAGQGFDTESTYGVGWNPGRHAIGTSTLRVFGGGAFGSADNKLFSVCDPWRVPPAGSAWADSAAAPEKWSDYHAPAAAYPAGTDTTTRILLSFDPRIDEPSMFTPEYNKACLGLPQSFSTAVNMLKNGTACSSHMNRAPAALEPPPIFHAYVVSFVPEVYSCQKKLKYQTPNATLADSESTVEAGTRIRETGKNTPPKKLRDALQMGDGAFQMRGLALGEANTLGTFNPADANSQWTIGERMISRVSGHGSDPGTNGFATAAILGRLSISQAEYFFMVNHPQNRATKFNRTLAPEDGDGKNGSIGSMDDLVAEAMWHMNWQARLKRFRFVNETNETSIGGPCTMNIPGSGKIKDKVVEYRAALCGQLENVADFMVGMVSVH